MIISCKILLILCSLYLVSICVPICHDNIPFSTKLAQSSVVIYGDIIKTSPLFSSKIFNITFHVKCILKGHLPKNETIIIEHTLPDNPICYRTLINGNTYIYFLNQTNIENYYQQIPFHELLYNDDTTVEILKHTCGIQTQSFGKILNKNQSGEQCPMVSIGCI